MEKRQLGRSDLYIAPLVFGGNVFGWTANRQESFALLDAFAAHGFNAIDTADVYSRWAPGNQGGESETIIGSWLKQHGQREKFVIATKVGADMGQGHRNVSKAYILQAVEKSLQRLQTDYIDLYQTHWDNDHTPVEETLEAYAELVKAGKVRWIGASNMSPERLSASLKASDAFGYPRYQTLQPLYNLYDRLEFERQYESICRDEYLGVISYYSLASGFLSGKYRSEKDFDQSPRGGGMTKYINTRGLRILTTLDEIANRLNTSPATVAIAWLIQRPGITAPIVSATKISQLNDLVNAIQLRLEATDIALLDFASNP